LLIWIPDVLIVGALVSTIGGGGDGGVEPRDNCTGMLALLENQAKSKATTSKVY